MTEIPLLELEIVKVIALEEHLLELEEIILESNSRNKAISPQEIDDIKLRRTPINNAQDLLRTMSGVFIAQHAGGGKAEQIFFRGFDNDHGTDFGVFVDDVPVNLSNHAHGQGYADLHFVIPELIQGADYYKGLYDPINGDFSVGGAVRFKTANSIGENSVKLDVGQYGFQRGLILLNLTPENNFLAKNKKERAYFALEGTLNKGYFESSQQFNKTNAMFKYTVQTSEKTDLSLTLSSFDSEWNASGQIPLRAVNNGQITRFGAIDDTEGGSTYRRNINLKSSTYFTKNKHWVNQAYYVKNYYQLFSNFTFFLNDSVNGDMIEQVETRDLLGFSSTYETESQFKKLNIKSTIATGVRADFVDLFRDAARQRQTLDRLDESAVSNINSWSYIKETLEYSDWLAWDIGARFDHFSFGFQNKLTEPSGTRTATRLSPKSALYLKPIPKLQLFLKGGTGFHSNYAHTAIEDRNIHPLPRAVSGEVGTEFFIGKKAVTNVTFWTTKSDAELIFLSDGGEFENKGRSLRKGIDVNTKIQPVKRTWLSVSANFSQGEMLDEPDEANTIPSAPRFSSTASLAYETTYGLDFLLSYRYLAKRVLVEDESVQADAYFLLDASINYKIKRFEIGLTAQNILNEKWQEAVFYDSSRLSNETEAVDDFHFTPGTPLFIKSSITYSF